MTVYIQLARRVDTAANWTANDPILALNQEGIESDTGKRKLGDGATAWTALAYFGSAGDVATDAIWDAKGDLAAGTGANTAAKLTVGANDLALVADSAEATGLKWAAPTPAAHASSHETGGSDPIDALTFSNTGLKILDSVGDHKVTIAISDDQNADRTLSFTMNDADRQIALGGNLSTVGAVTITNAAATVLDDTTVAAMVDTLGGASSGGTGGLARLNSPSFTTPALGTPSALVATNATGTATGLTAGITNALKSATTTVDVSAATAPSTGQVLTATGSTAATWQAPFGYSLHVVSTNIGTLADSASYYFGARAAAAVTTEGFAKVWIPRSGTIKAINIVSSCGTSGGGDAWSFYLRLNGTTDTLIETVSSSAGYREWRNASLSISVTAGDYVEIKMVNPAWATNPANMTIGGHIYIE